MRASLSESAGQQVEVVLNLLALCLAFHARYVIASAGMAHREGRRSRRQLGGARRAAPACARCGVIEGR